MGIVVGINSWVTADEADTYMLDRFSGDAWAGYTPTKKEQLLITAYRWIKSKTYLTIPANSTAVTVKNAQVECAWYIAQFWTGHEKRSALQSQGVTEFELSKFREKLSRGTDLPEFVKDLLGDFLTGEYFPTFTRENN